MADNVTTPVPDGTKLAFDEVTIGGDPVKVGRNKIGFGTDGQYTEVSTDNRLPVALPEGFPTSAKQDEATTAIGKLGSARRFFDIVPANTALSATPDAIYVGGAGNLVLRGSDGVDATLAVMAGQMLPVSPAQVRAATTATGLVGLIA